MDSKIIALLFAIFTLVSMVAIPGLSLAPTTQTAYAQWFGGEEEDEDFDPNDLAGDIVSDVLGEEEAADTEQTIDQPIEQETNQEVDQSEDNDQDNDNTQTQAGAIDQDTEQGIVDGDDSAKSESESGDAKHKSISSSESGDAENVNAQDAENNAELNQDQHQDVTQTNTVVFGDDTVDLDAVNVAIPIAVPINLDEQQEDEEQPESASPECPSIGNFPSTFNPETGLCEANAPPACELGDLNTETDECEPVGIPPSCPIEGDFEYNEETNLCEANAPPI